MPQFFNDLGYKSHMVGKWNLGHDTEAYLPQYRGFDGGFYGVKLGGIDHFDHWAVQPANLFGPNPTGKV